MRRLIAPLIALILTGLVAGTALGHGFSSGNAISVSVSCAGYSATFNADIYGGHGYVVTVGDDTFGPTYTDANDNNTAFRDFGPFEGTATSGTVTVTILNPDGSTEAGPQSKSFTFDGNCAPTPTLTSECAPNDTSYAWKINLAAGEPDYNIDWSFDSGFAGATTVDFVSAGDHSFTTPRGGTTLYVRWSSDHESKAEAAANTALCQQVVEAATGTPVQVVLAATGTPAATIPDTSVNGDWPSSLPTILFSTLLLASLVGLAVTNVKTAQGTRRIR